VNAHTEYLNQNHTKCLDALNQLQERKDLTKDVYTQIGLMYLQSCYITGSKNLYAYAHNFSIYSEEFGSYKPPWRKILQLFFRFLITENKGDAASSLRAEVELVKEAKQHYGSLDQFDIDSAFNGLIGTKLALWKTMPADLDVEDMIRDVGQLFAQFKEDPSAMQSFLKKI